MTTQEAKSKIRDVIGSGDFIRNFTDHLSRCPGDKIFQFKLLDCYFKVTETTVCFGLYCHDKRSDMVRKIVERLPTRDNPILVTERLIFEKEGKLDAVFNLNGMKVKIGKGKNESGRALKLIDVALPLDISGKRDFEDCDKKSICDAFKSVILRLLDGLWDDLAEGCKANSPRKMLKNAEGSDGVAGDEHCEQEDVASDYVLADDFLRCLLSDQSEIGATEREVFRFSEELARRKVVKFNAEKVKLERDKQRTSYFDLGFKEIDNEMLKLNGIMSELDALLESGDPKAKECFEEVSLLLKALRSLVFVLSKEWHLSHDEEMELTERIEKFHKTRAIIRSFRHTHRKDYENYVVTGIWHRLRGMNLQHDLEPVTQQYVKRDNGYALLDLYFPQIKVAVECDEAYHLHNKSADAKREYDVFKAFKDCEFDANHKTDDVDDLEAMRADTFDSAGLKLARVDASVPYDLIDKQLDEIAENIKKIYESVGSPEWDVRPSEEKVLNMQEIHVKDQFVFENIPAVMKGLRIKRSDGGNISNWWKGGWPVKNTDKVIVWFPVLTRKNAKWTNIVEDGGDKILEHRSKNGFGEKAKVDWLEAAENFDDGIRFVRIVFGHSRNSIGEDGYRFMGVYRLSSYGPRDGEGYPTWLEWERVSLSLELKSTWQEMVQSVRKYQAGEKRCNVEEMK